MKLGKNLRNGKLISKRIFNKTIYEKKYNPRNLRRLNARRPAHFAYDEDDGGDTLEDKLETINEYLFGGVEVFTYDENYLSGATAFFLQKAEKAKGEEKEIWGHLAHVISYLEEETDEKPQSLAVAKPCQKLQEYRLDYAEDTKDRVRDFCELRVESAKDDEDEDFFEEDLNDIIDGGLMDECVDYCTDYNDKEALSNLAGNVEEISEVVRRDFSYYNKNIREIDTKIREKYVDEYIYDILDEEMEKTDSEDDNGLMDTIRRKGKDYALWYAAENGEYDKVARLLDMDADVNSSPEDGKTALMRAVYNQHEDVVELLLGCKDLEIDLDTYGGMTALSIATNNRDADMMETLLKAGADPKAGYRSAISIAKDNGDEDVLNFLKEYLEDIKQQKTLKAAYDGDIEELEKLFSQGVSVDTQDDGEYILMTAIRQENLDTFEFLIKQGANVNVADKDGDTPLMIAVKWENMDMIKRLIEEGSNVNAKADNGDTALKRAKGNKEITDYLKKHGAK